MAPAGPSEGSFLGGRRRGRLRTCGFFFQLWNLHSVSLGKNSVYLHKCLALGLRNHHVDVHSSEEADSGKRDETVRPDGLLGERRESRREGGGTGRGRSWEASGSLSVASLCDSRRSERAGTLGPALMSGRTPQPFHNRDPVSSGLGVWRRGSRGACLQKQEGGSSKELCPLPRAPGCCRSPLTSADGSPG